MSKECFFKCGVIDKELITSGDRIGTIIIASIQRNDTLHIRLQTEMDNNDNFTIQVHKNCLCTYTSFLHISRCVNRQNLKASSSNIPIKRRRRSEVKTYCFQNDCIFCGEICIMEKDPKNPSVLKRWALSLHLCSKVCQDLNAMMDNETEAMTKHKEEMTGRIVSDTTDRLKIRNKLSSCIDPLDPNGHPPGITDSVTGRIATDTVNVDNAV